MDSDMFEKELSTGVCTMAIAFSKSKMPVIKTLQLTIFDKSKVKIRCFVGYFISI